MPPPRIAGREPPPRFFLENGDKQQVAAAPARPGRRDPQARREGHDDHALQGPGRDGRRGAVGHDARPGQADAAAGAAGRRAQGRRAVPHR